VLPLRTRPLHNPLGRFAVPPTEVSNRTFPTATSLIKFSRAGVYSVRAICSRVHSSTVARHCTLQRPFSCKLLKPKWRRERDSDPLRVLKAWRLLILRSAKSSKSIRTSASLHLITPRPIGDCSSNLDQLHGLPKRSSFDPRRFDACRSSKSYFSHVPHR
jgi:hypothetical protein